MKITLSQFAFPSSITLGAIVILFVIGGIFKRITSHRTGKAEPRIDNCVVESTKVPSPCRGAAIRPCTGVGLNHARHLSMAIFMMMIISFTITLSTLAGKIFRDYLQNSQLAMPTTGLACGIFQGTIDLPGISLAPPGFEEWP